jgi:hypothetical protein
MIRTKETRVGNSTRDRSMRGIGILPAIPLLFVLALILSSCGLGGALSVAAPTSRVLFIGNSFTFFNDGVDQVVKGLDPSIAVERQAVGGYSLQDHWNDGHALIAIRAQKWNFVVLQEQSQLPVTTQAQFIQYVGRFSKEIKANGAQPILFMTWQRPDSVQSGVTTHNLAYAYWAAGNQTGATVAPAGLAFSLALQKKPDLALAAQDGHPTLAGTYLAGCVLYATMFGKSPVGNPYAPASLSTNDRDFLQRVAAEIMGY